MKKILTIALTTAALALFTGCGGKEKKQVEDFAGRFANHLKSENQDSLSAYYPDADYAEEYVTTLTTDSLSINKLDGQGEYEVKYNDHASMIVTVAEGGKISVKESKGLFKFSPNKIAFAKKLGATVEGLTDVELAKVMLNVDNLSTSLYNEYVEKRKGAVKNLGYTVTKDIMYMMDQGEGYYTLKNTTDQPIGGDEYEITMIYSYLGPGVETHDKKVLPGKDIPAGGTVRYKENFTGHYGADIQAITVHTPSKEDFYKNFTPTGDEYSEYVKVNGKEPAKRAALGYGPFALAGKIGGKYPVHMTLDKGMKTGSYYYDKNGPKAVLTLSVKEYNKNTGDLTIEEKDDKGDVTGTFVGVLTPEAYTGKMTSNQGKTYDFTLTVE